MKKLCRNTMLILGIVMLNCSFLNSSEYTKEASYPFIGADMQWVDSVFNTMTLADSLAFATDFPSHFFYQIFVLFVYRPQLQLSWECNRTI